MTNVRITWNGDAIKREMERATVEGMETVAGAFVRAAHPRTPIKRGYLRRSTRFLSLIHI